ncbi:MAG: acyl--CoA ligase, partial [Clostridiales bacterium]|nr:acyl--CoA ligase [Clostridiales bacterium]
MDNPKLNIGKTKYRYFMDNVKLEGTAIIYTIPVPKGEEKPTDEFFDRDYPDVKISYKKLIKMIDKTAAALVAYGVKKGDIVTVCQTNTPEIFYMDYAMNKIGAIPNYIYPNITADEMKYFIEELGSKYVFVLDEPDIKKNMKKALEGTDIKVISSSVIEAFPPLFKMIANKKKPVESVAIPNEIKWADFIKNGKIIKNINENPYIPDDTCSIVHSSGTSSVPKAVIISNENINYIAKSFDRVQKANHTAVQTIPEFVVYGTTTNHSMFVNGLKIVFIPEMEPKNFYDLVHKYKPSYSFATPSHAREMVKRDTDMTNAIDIGFGGDGFDDIEDELTEYMFKNGSTYPPFQGYGSTEISAVGITNLTYPGYYKKGSLGRPFGENEIILLDPETSEQIVNPNTVGEVCITGPGVTKGYAGNSKEETEKVFVKHPDGKTYVHMGDLLSFDEDGFYYYHGRIKNIIKRKSFAFSPQEIIDAIMKHENVKSCMVIPRYSREEGETPSAHIVLNDYSDTEKTLEGIKKLVADNVQEFHRPTHYKIRQAIPLTKNNKNNITALKIEDTATMFDGVVSANIEAHNTSEYEFYLKVKIKSDKTDEEIEKALEEHINKI